MKKNKKISVRLSQEDYDIMVNDYLWYKKDPEWTKLIFKQEINTFSEYIRLMIKSGIND